MGMPTDIGVIDLMLGIPEGSKKDWYGFLRSGLMDKESKDEFEFPAQYMFKEVPKDLDPNVDPVKAVLDEMDHFGIERAQVGVSFERSRGIEAVRDHPDRFFGSYEVNPNTRHGRRPQAAAGRRGARRQGGQRLPRRHDARRCPSTTRSSSRSTPSASSSTSRSRCAPACPGPGCRWRARRPS